FLALLLQPLAEWLHKRARFPSGLALTAVVLVVVIAGLAVVGFMALSLQDVVAAAPNYRDRLTEQLGSLTTWLDGLARRTGVSEQGVDFQGLPAEVLGSPGFRRAVISTSQAIAGSLGNLFLTFFIFAFALGGVVRLDTKLERKGAPTRGLEVRFMAFSAVIRRYMGVRAVLGLVASALNYLLLLVLGVDFALLWAVLSFVLSFVPNIGYTLSVIPPILLALVEGGWQRALLVFVGYTIINNVVDNVVGPRYVGAQMNISALLSFLSVIFWAWVLGPTGAILSVPLTVFIRQVLLEQGGPPPSDAAVPAGPAPTSPPVPPEPPDATPAAPAPPPATSQPPE
ncbi:MAG TPA: AI-2E family transporter, partial [Longimicrobiaceae bacterium]|nr:AI-2E family transporter [Longimicrobiaceae bacterium]